LTERDRADELEALRARIEAALATRRFDLVRSLMAERTRLALAMGKARARSRGLAQAPRCEGVRRNGAPCGGFAVRGSNPPRCAHHEAAQGGNTTRDGCADTEALRGRW
jgi:hypothetical protein